MENRDVIQRLEDGYSYSKIILGPFNSKIIDYLSQKNLQKLFEVINNVIITTTGKLVETKINRLIYRTNTEFYLDLYNETSLSPVWYLKVYYDVNRSDEAKIFVNKIINDYRDEIDNNR